jgi:restriction system protein
MRRDRASSIFWRTAQHGYTQPGSASILLRRLNLFFRLSRGEVLKFPEPAKGSLFALLVRAPFWASLLIAGALFAVARNFLPNLLAAATTLPFLGTAAFAGWRQFKTPSPTRVTETLDALRDMTWVQFSAVIAETFRREGYDVGALEGGVANYELHKNGYKSLLSCKRWKVAQTGIVPLRELFEAMQARAARDCIYIATGDFTETARAFALEKGMRVLNGAELAKLVGRVVREKKAEVART